MTRLTKKGVAPVDAIQTSTDIANLYHVYNKLSKLEDIEEELGVDLIKLLTAKTIFTIANDYGGIFYHIDIENGGVYTSTYDADDEFYPFSDYGKTWALDKSDLVNDI